MCVNMNYRECLHADSIWENDSSLINEHTTNNSPKKQQCVWGMLRRGAENNKSTRGLRDTGGCHYTATHYSRLQSLAGCTAIDGLRTLACFSSPRYWGEREGAGWLLLLCVALRVSFFPYCWCGVIFLFSLFIYWHDSWGSVGFVYLSCCIFSVIFLIIVLTFLSFIWCCLFILLSNIALFQSCDLFSILLEVKAAMKDKISFIQ